MYKVVKAFADLQDKEHLYGVGDEYPRAGLEVSKNRIAELEGANNLQGVPLIEKVVQKRKSKKAE